MSYTTMFAIGEGGEVLDSEEFRNSWGSAPFVWCALSEKLFGDQYAYNYMGRGSVLASPEHADINFWNVWCDEPYASQLERFEKAVFIGTFDKAVVKAENLKQFQEDLRAFQAKWYVGERLNCAMHRGGFDKTIDKWVKEFGDKLWGVCWHGTSVTENPWDEWVKPGNPKWKEEEDGAYDEETKAIYEGDDEWEGHSVPYDFDPAGENKSEGHYFVYSMLAEYEEEQKNG